MQFMYQDGWPTLNENNIFAAKNAIHANLKVLREQRIFALEEVDRHVRMLTRYKCICSRTRVRIYAFVHIYIC